MLGLVRAVLRNALGSAFVSAGIAVVSAALAFGVYHFAHSPPFNTPAMVLLLSGVGVTTAIFFFVGGDLHSTIVLHNAHTETHQHSSRQRLPATTVCIGVSQ